MKDMETPTQQGQEKKAQFHLWQWGTLVRRKTESPETQVANTREAERSLKVAI